MRNRLRFRAFKLCTCLPDRRNVSELGVFCSPAGELRWRGSSSGLPASTLGARWPEGHASSPANFSWRHVLPMEVYFDSRVDTSDTYWTPDDGSVSATIVRPTDEVLERNDLTRFGVFFWADKKAPSKAEAKVLSSAD